MDVQAKAEAEAKAKAEAEAKAKAEAEAKAKVCFIMRVRVVLRGAVYLCVSIYLFGPLLSVLRVHVSMVWM